MGIATSLLAAKEVAVVGSCALTAVTGVAGGGVVIHNFLSSSKKQANSTNNSPNPRGDEGEKSESREEDLSDPDGPDIVRNLEGFECHVNGTSSIVTQDTACVENPDYRVSPEGYLNPAELNDDEIQIDSPVEPVPS